MLRGALAALLSIEADIEVLGSFSDGEQALRAVGKQRPEVLVTDIEMPKMTGLELAAALKASHPEVRTIILTTFARPGYLRRAMDAGARGYLLKDRPAAELADAVRRVYQGLRVVDPALATEAWSAEPDPLTERERQILQRAGDGRSSTEISAELHLSEGTVRNYLSDVIAKLGAANRAVRTDKGSARGRRASGGGAPRAVREGNSRIRRYGV